MNNTLLRTELSVESKQKLIVGEMEHAYKMAHHLLKNWGAFLSGDEVKSICNMALCEAARGYRPQNGATFFTYASYYLKGCLVHEIKSRCINHEHQRCECELTNATHQTVLDTFACDDPSPERIASLHEFGAEICDWWAHNVDATEGQICATILCDGEKVSAAAKKYHYSRGHASLMHNRLLKKLREDFAEFREAA